MGTELSGIMELALQQGIWATLYIYLFFRMLKENKEREERYQRIIDQLSGKIENGIDRIQLQLEKITDTNDYNNKMEEKNNE